MLLIGNIEYGEATYPHPHVSTVRTPLGTPDCGRAHLSEVQVATLGRTHAQEAGALQEFLQEVQWR